MPTSTTQQDDRLGAIANATRRRILRLTWDVERSPSELADAVGLSRPATSQHLRVLLEAELVRVREEGRHRWYSTREDTIADLRRFLDEFWGDRLARLKTAAEQRARQVRR